MTASGNKPQTGSWIAGAAALLSIAACYGTLGLVAILSAMGVTLAINEQVWAGVIVGFAVMAVLFITMGYSHHRSHNPARLAIVGAALIIWAMYGSDGIRDLIGVPQQVVEIAGFAALLGAAWLDRKLRRRT